MFGEGNSYVFKYRLEDSRIGRFFSVDKLSSEWPELTPFQFASNSPIACREIEGLEGKYYVLDLNSKSPQLKYNKTVDYWFVPNSLEPDYIVVEIPGPNKTYDSYTFTVVGVNGKDCQGCGNGNYILDFEKFKKNPLDAIASGDFVSDSDLMKDAIRDIAISLIIGRIIKSKSGKNSENPQLSLPTQRDRLLNGVTNEKLKSTISRLWRKGATYAGGSTGDAMRGEKKGMKFPNSDNHKQKANEALNTMRDLLNGNHGKLSDADRKKVFEIIGDLTRDTGLKWMGLNYDYLKGKPKK